MKFVLIVLIALLFLAGCAPGIEEQIRAVQLGMLSNYAFLFQDLTDIKLYSINTESCYAEGLQRCVPGQARCYCDYAGRMYAQSLWAPPIQLPVAVADMMKYNTSVERDAVFDAINTRNAAILSGLHNLDCAVSITKTSCIACGKEVLCNSRNEPDIEGYVVRIHLARGVQRVGDKTVKAIVIKGPVKSTDTHASLGFFSKDVTGTFVARDGCMVYYQKFIYNSAAPQTEESYANMLCA